MLDLTAIPQLARNLSRLAEIARVLTKYGLANWLARLDSASVRRWAGGTAIVRLSEVSHEARVRLALTELGTTFIKLGQVLSTRRDLVGSALADELAQLQGNVPADPFPVTKELIEAELKRPLAELFPEFEAVAIASASIGQVHRATLHDGRRVVVKVQHPGIARRVADDLAIVSELAGLAERFLPDVRSYRPVAVVAEFNRVLIRELDFRRELRHLQMFRYAFAADPGVCVPEPFPAFSTGLVLTMEYLDGIPFTHIEKVKAAGGDPDALARCGARIFLEMIFRDGFFHADPHPGNLLYLPPGGDRPEGCIGLLDVGMVGRLDARMRDRIERAVTAVVRQDAAVLTDLVAQVGDVPAKFDADALEGEVAEQLAFYWGMPLEQFQLGTALNEVTDAIRRYQVMLPPPLAMLLRVLVILEGTGRLLSPKFNLVELLEPYKRTLILKKLSPRRVLQRALAGAQDWDDLVRSLPRQFGGLMRMMQRQEVGVQLMHRHLEPSVNRLVFGLLVSALFLGSAVMWAAKAPPLVWDVSVFGVLGCVVAGVLGFYLFRAIQHSGRLEERE
ncbi:MAG: AarF/ABC1/UbiB kinase family protein [Gemmataceae bacterium]|nr:AarF/ABC1/UbiB kinase family protein [Gemmataceae bacterium]